MRYQKAVICPTKEGCWLEHTALEKDVCKVGKTAHGKHLQCVSPRMEGKNKTRQERVAESESQRKVL